MPKNSEFRSGSYLSYWKVTTKRKTFCFKMATLPAKESGVEKFGNRMVESTDLFEKKNRAVSWKNGKRFQGNWRLVPTAKKAWKFSVSSTTRCFKHKNGVFGYCNQPLNVIKLAGPDVVIISGFYCIYTIHAYIHTMLYTHSPPNFIFSCYIYNIFTTFFELQNRISTNDYSQNS